MVIQNENDIVGDEVVHTEDIDDIDGTHFGGGNGKNENGYKSKASDLNTETLRSLDSEDSMGFEETDVNTSSNSQHQRNSTSDNRNSRKTLSKPCTK